MAKKSPGRPTTDTFHLSVSLPGNARPMLDALANLGLYGSTPTEVLRRLVLEGLEKKIFDMKVLDGRWGAESKTK